ncbi:MAG TPA: hypothetical protein GX716_03255 [Firmicutes bacterium]|nr:hypothetical protein [Candidatus Fermentithermobacillaceae bacterium]
MAHTGYLTPSCIAKDVGATSTKVCDALPPSTGITYRLFQNISDDADIYLGLGKAAETNKGLVIRKSGDYEMTIAKGNLYLGEICAIHAGTGNKTLLVTQG